MRVIAVVKITDSQVKSQIDINQNIEDSIRRKLHKWMQSILMAISDLIAGVLNKLSPKKEEKKAGKVKEKEPSVPLGYRPLFFHCWLCDGITKFACKNSIKHKRFKIDCARCGVENLVTVNSPKK
jgi:hypothetical protein